LHVAACDDDVGGGERDDARQRLGVEDDERAGDSVDGVEIVVSQQVVSDAPAFFGVGRCGAGALVAGRQAQPHRNLMVALCPGQERPHDPADRT
jgi:hypothetical protein